MGNKKGEMGVGVLIVFIAMLLVAAIAAGVLITTITSLQQKALSTGAETKGEISTHVSVVEVTAEDGSDGDFENVTTLIKLSAGSDPVNLTNTLVSLGLNDGTANYRWCPGQAASTSCFDLTYEVSGPEQANGFLNRGDVVALTLIPTRNIGTDEAVRITYIPKVGTQSVVEFRTPSVISRQLMTVFP